MFNKIYLISTINIFIQQYAFAFNFNPGYFHSTTNIRSTSAKKVMLFNKNIYSTSSFAILIQQKYVFNFKIHYLYSTKIFIQLQPSLSLFNKNICSTSSFAIFIQQSKVPGHTDKYTFNKLTRPYPRRFINTC